MIDATIDGAPTWAIDPVPVLEIGGAEGERESLFTYVTGAQKLSDGRILIADELSARVIYFGPDGQYLQRIGGLGEGPGEFRWVDVLVRLQGDTILTGNIYDLAWFDETGRLVRERAVPRGAYRKRLPEYHSLMGTSGLERVVVAGGTAAFHTCVSLSCDYPTPPPGQNHRLAFDVSWMPFEGPVTRIGEVAGPDLEESPQALLEAATAPRAPWQERVRGCPFPAPFPLDPDVAAGGDPTVIYFSDSRRYEFFAYDVEARDLRVIKAPRDPVEIRDQDYEDKARHMIASSSSTRERTEDCVLTFWSHHTPLSETFPRFADLTVDDDGNLWVQDYERPADDRSRWTVFDRNGTVLGRVQMTAAVRLMAAGDDYLLTLTWDELNLPYVREYRLTRSVPRVIVGGSTSPSPARKPQE